MMTALIVLGMLFCMAGTSEAFAGEAQSLPWEGPLQKLASSLTGPVAQAICLIAIVVCGFVLIFGGEIGEFAKRLVYIVIVVAFILGAAGIVKNGFFGASGACISEQANGEGMPAPEIPRGTARLAWFVPVTRVSEV